MSNLIKRDKAIDYFVTNIGIVDADGYAVDDYDERVKIWTERFSGIPSAELERKWIPVTDRLPKDNRQVLVYAQSTHFALAKYDEMMEPNGEWKKQWVTFDAWKPYYTIENVIAWMPLPEPWRGE